LGIFPATALRVLAVAAFIAHSHGAFAAELAAPNPRTSAGGQASGPTSIVGTSTTNSGKAKLCALEDVKFDTYKEISIPPTSAFRDWGIISASKDDPGHWAIPHGELPAGEHLHAAFVTLDAVNLSKTHRCGETRVKMLVAPLASDSSQTAAVNHLFALDDVLDYPIPTKRPPVEMGTLIDDMSIFAVLTADVNEAYVSTKATMDDTERAAKCLDGARKLAAYMNAGWALRQPAWLP
jgi:hypothetical protein